MTWHVHWEEIAEQSWKLLPPRAGERIAVAVDRFAKHREGDVEIISRDPHITCRLRVGTYLLELFLDETTSTVVVLWLISRP